MAELRHIAEPITSRSRQIPMRRITTFTVAGLVGLLAVGCGSDDPPATTTEATTAATDAAATTPTSTAATDPAVTDELGLAGASFLATEVTGQTLVPDSELIMSFTSDGTLSINAGCNVMNGGYTVEAGVLTVGVMISTQMACEQPLMDQDMWISELVTSGPTIARNGDQLVLTGTDVTVTMTDLEVAKPDLELTGTVWTITGLVRNDAVSSVPAGAETSLVIGDDGTLAVQTGCNSGSGAVTVTDRTITIGALAVTKKACSDELNELERTVLSVLSGDVDYAIEADTLTLTSDGGGLQLQAAG